jgi:hypothetical protein
MTDVIDHTSLLPRRFAERLFKSFESDARLIQNQFSMLTDEVRAVKTSMTNFIRHPLDETLSQLIAPLAAIVIRSLGKKRSSAKPARSSPAKT